MNTIAQPERICGIDTHSDFHVAAVTDLGGRLVDIAEFPATLVGYRQLLDWLNHHGEVRIAGIEGTSSYGRGITRFLMSHRVQVVEVIRPNRQARRRNGKSDPADAVAAARAILSGEAEAIPKTGEGPIEDIRTIQIARTSAIKARTQTSNQLRDLILTAPHQLHDQLHPLTTQQRANHCKRIRPDTHLKATLRTLARRYQYLTTEITELTERLNSLTRTTAPTLCALKGVGPDVAAKLLITAGDNPHRIHSDPAFAALCGVAPIDASSGKQQRHRLNRGGDRQANNALWTITIVRMSSDQRTRDYVTRRTQQGLTKPEIIRCLKRYIARETRQAILKDLPQLV